jgi:DNA-binding GntR family transcriptional regulator
MSLSTFRTKREVAAELLREEIIGGALLPGTRLMLEELSKRYQLSMTPIREAFSLLESEGLISQSPHKGATVAPLDREELLELYAIRGAVEALATFYGVPRLTDEDLAKMEQLLIALEAFKGSWDGFLNIDIQFHRIMYQAAGSPRWMETIETLWRRSRRYMLVSASASGMIETLHSDHRMIFLASQDHDAELATNVIRAHLKRAEARLLEQWR